MSTGTLAVVIFQSRPGEAIFMAQKQRVSGSELVDRRHKAMARPNRSGPDQ
jgi:hypothetical protein